MAAERASPGAPVCVEVEGRDGVRLLFPADRPQSRLPEGFDRPGWAPSGEEASLGRGGAVAMRWPDGRACFYRPYRHGGLFGALRGDGFRSDGPLRQEIEDGLRLLTAGLAIAPPVVGRVEGAGPRRLALVTERVDGEPLSRHTAPGAPQLRVLRRAGVACAALHRAGFRHKDLHPGNWIVRPDGDLALLDLVGGRWGGAHGDPTARRSLVRMARWIEKHQGGPATLRMVSSFLQGYEPRRSARRQLLADLRTRYRRQVRLRRLVWRLRGLRRGRAGSGSRGESASGPPAV